MLICTGMSDLGAFFSVRKSVGCRSNGAISAIHGKSSNGGLILFQDIQLAIAVKPLDNSQPAIVALKKQFEQPITCGGKRRNILGHHSNDITIYMAFTFTGRL